MLKQGKLGKVVTLFVVGVILMISIVAFGVLAQNEPEEENELTDVEKEEIEEILEDVTESEVSEQAQEYVEEFVEQRGIDPEDISNVSRIEFEDLPKEVAIENVDESNIGIFEVEFDDPEGDAGDEIDKVFVITYSVPELKAQGDLIIAHDKRQFLHFGYSGSSESERFLETATGVESTLEKGYVMTRDGSITAISTNIEITETTDSVIEVIIYKNGESISFGNTLDATESGVQTDYDVQSNEVVTFEPGDVLSAYVQSSDGTIWNDAIVLVEITTTN